MLENLPAIILYLLWLAAGGCFLSALFKKKKALGLPSFEPRCDAAFLFVMLLVLSVYFAANFAAFIAGKFSIEPDKMVFAASFLQNIFWIISACIFLALSKIRAGFFPAKFAEGLKIFLEGIFYLLMFFPFLSGISLLWGQVLQAAGFDVKHQDVVLMFAQIENIHVKIMAIFSIAILAPVAEELVFRGCLGGALKYRFGKYASALAVAALFALVHGSLYAFLPLFALSLFWSFLYEKFGDLRIAIAGHFAFNGINILALIFDDVLLYK